MSHQIKPIAPMVKRFALTPLCCALALILPGCASTPAPDADATFEPPVFPAPPDEARFIFERSLRYNSNVQTKPQISALRRFATGEKDEVKGLVKPFDVAAHDGKVFVTDTVQRKLIMFDISGGNYAEYGRTTPGELLKPIGLDIAPNGDVYVADVSAKRITVFNNQGQFLRYIGNAELLYKPSDVAVSRDGKTVYVIDTGGVETQSHHLLSFDAITGEHLKTIGQRGKEKGEFNLPLQLTTTQDGLVHVVDKGNFRIQSFNQAGELVQSFGTIGRLPGQFFSPKGIAADSDGNIYVVDTAFGNVQIFNAEGQLLMVIGQRRQSSAPGNYMLPAGIDVDDEGRVYIVDQFFRKVDIYRPINLTPMSQTSDSP